MFAIRYFVTVTPIFISPLDTWHTRDSKTVVQSRGCMMCDVWGGKTKRMIVCDLAQSVS
ncbi:hypothetical protein DPMN_148678 [Dreissena polymorpha]|uniref:Uncharacterized protein n=1 Tax=Dreissena polymorpha TaxID=45954 RepID=A0A9D4FEJ0_DREPO|nr:hypothetical protein DPMN_148678 [Dreissena polymorpha]